MNTLHRFIKGPNEKDEDEDIFAELEAIESSDVPRVSKEDYEIDEMQPMQQQANAWAEILPGLSRSVYEKLAKIAPTNLDTEEEGHLQELRRRISEKGQNTEEAMQELWGQEFSDAPPRLREALAGGMVMSEMSPTDSSADIFDELSDIENETDDDGTSLSSVLSGAKTVFGQIPSMVTDVIPETIGRAIRRGDETIYDTPLDEWIKENVQEREEAKTLTEEERGKTWFNILGVKVTKGHAEDAADSIGYSIVNAATTFGAKALTTMALAPVLTPIGSTIAGIGAGFVGGTAISQGATKDQFIEMVKDEWELAHAGEQMTPELQQQWQEIYNEVEGDADWYGFWEAAPETAGNLLTLGIAKLPVGKAIAPLLGKVKKEIANGIGVKVAKTLGIPALKLAAMLTEESVTEMVTQKKQADLEFERGFRDKPISYEEALEEVLPMVITTTPFMGGGIGIATKLAEKMDQKAKEDFDDLEVIDEGKEPVKKPKKYKKVDDSKEIFEGIQKDYLAGKLKDSDVKALKDQLPDTPVGKNFAKRFDTILAEGQKQRETAAQEKVDEFNKLTKTERELKAQASEVYEQAQDEFEAGNRKEGKRLLDEYDKFKTKIKETAAEIEKTLPGHKKTEVELTRVTTEAIDAVGERVFGRSFEKGKVKVAPEDSETKNLRKVAEATKLGNINFFDPNGTALEDINGFYDTATKQIYLNKKAERPLLVVLAHESLHKLKKEFPKLYASLKPILAGKAIGFNEYLAKLNEKREKSGIALLDSKKASEEFIADFVGQTWKKSSFWNKLHKEDPNITRKLAEVLTELIKKIRKVLTGRDAQKYFKDFDAIETEIAKIYAQYARPEGKKEAVSGIPKITSTFEAKEFAKIATPEQIEQIRAQREEVLKRAGEMADQSKEAMLAGDVEKATKLISDAGFLSQSEAAFLLEAIQAYEGRDFEKKQREDAEKKKTEQPPASQEAEKDLESQGYKKKILPSGTIRYTKKDGEVSHNVFYKDGVKGRESTIIETEESYTADNFDGEPHRIKIKYDENGDLSRNGVSLIKQDGTPFTVTVGFVKAEGPDGRRKFNVSDGKEAIIERLELVPTKEPTAEKIVQPPATEEVEKPRATLDSVAQEKYGKPYIDLTPYEQGVVSVLKRSKPGGTKGVPTPEDMMAEWDKQVKAKGKETVAHASKAVQALKDINKILGEKGEISGEFNEDKWKQIRPLLKTAWDETLAAGKSAAEFVTLAIETLSPKGRPYFEKFVKEEMGEPEAEKEKAPWEMTEKELADAIGSPERVFIDNPGGEWLKHERDLAIKGRGGARTTTIRRVVVPIDELIILPGRNEEHELIKEDDKRVAKIVESIQKDGWDSTYVPFLNVEHDGSVNINEGNHRIRAAKLAGLKEIAVEIGYFAGGERVKGLMSLERLIEFNEQRKKKVEPTTTSKRTPSLKLAEWVSGNVLGQTKISWRELFRKADEFFKGTQGEGAYVGRDAYDAMELGINMAILNYMPEITVHEKGAFSQGTIVNLQSILNFIPTQTKRTTEQQEFQQFSTPPPLAYMVNWVANIQEGETYLEPSAGVGGLALFGKKAGANVITNELSPRRSTLLELLGFEKIYNEDAEQLDNILPESVKPTVIVMNPPFSSTAGRLKTNQTKYGGRHVEQALHRLEPNGRLVAIVGKGMAMDAPAHKEWWKKIQSEYGVRANIRVSGKEYAKYGTTFDNRILVIDKTEKKDYIIVQGNVETVEELPALLEDVRKDRKEVQDGSKHIRDRQSKPAPPKSTRSETTETGEGTGGKTPDTSDSTTGLGGTKRGSGAGSTTVQPGQVTGIGTRDEQPAKDRGSAETGRDVEAGRSGETGRGSGANVSRSDARKSGLKVTSEKETKREGEISDSLYENYLARVTIAGAQPHPTPLVESAAMADTTSPKTDYVPNIPIEVIKSGQISDIQLEQAVYAGAAHDKFLPNGERRGYFDGDGTGVGKGRTIAAILWDNWRRGRRKAVWFSEKASLFKDAKRDVTLAGWESGVDKLFKLSGTKLGNKVQAKEGIMFGTYSTLGSQFEKLNEAEPESLHDMKIRLNQVADWFGKDYDGVIVFDESHNMGNAVPTRGKRGMKKPAKKAMAGVSLQKLLPKARIVYMSATGATEVNNLTYARRLGLWGKGTSFSNATKFIGEVESGGLMAMELLARDMKSQGSYLARTLSYEGVEHDRLEHKLNNSERKMYDVLSTAWQTILHNIDAAVEETQSKAKMSIFWGAHQRFFQSVVVSLQTPSVIKHAKQQLANGEAVVIQLVDTGEAQQNRSIDSMEEGQDYEDLDFTPRENMVNYLKNSFPVQQYEKYLDEDGKERTRPVFDSNGEPVLNRQAVARRDRLIAEAASIKVPASSLDTLIEAFGADNVTEVTGRSRRLVSDENGEPVMQKRTEGIIDQEILDFEDDKRKVLIFSGKGGTGSSYHAGRDFINQRRRNHYLLQPGWRADKAIQGLGRSHRSNQAVAPHFYLVSTDLEGQKRFLSTIARRLDQLGSLTKGQRQTGSQGIFQARDNLENDYARNALVKMFEDLDGELIEGITAEEYTEQTGLSLRNDDNAFTPPSMRQFLNRLLSMNIPYQKLVFDHFNKKLDAIVQAAAENGTLDIGVETITGVDVKKVKEEVIHTDKESGAQTKYVNVDVTNETQKITFENSKDVFYRKSGGTEYMQNIRSKRIWVISDIHQKTNEDGSIDEFRRLKGPNYYTSQQIKATVLKNPELWKKASTGEARTLWNKEFEALPDTTTSKIHMITGAILPIWERLPRGETKIFRTQTNDGERLLGRVIPEAMLKQTLENFGVGVEKIKMVGKDIATQVLEYGSVVRLSNGWRIKRSRVSGEQRIELTGPSWGDTHEIKAAGVFDEIISYQTRYFIPKASAAEVIDDLIEFREIISFKQGYAGPSVAELSIKKGQIDLFDKKEAEKDIFGQEKQKVAEKKVEPKAKFGQKMTPEGKKKPDTPTEKQLDLFGEDKKQIQTTMFDVKDPVPVWYSQMENVLDKKLPNKGTPKSMIQAINSFAKKGEYKKEELEWSGVNEWLDEQGRVRKWTVKKDAHNFTIEERDGRYYVFDPDFGVAGQATNNPTLEAAKASAVLAISEREGTEVKDASLKEVAPNKVTKQQVLDYLKENNVRVEEVVKGEEEARKASAAIDALYEDKIIDEDMRWSEFENIEPDNAYLDEETKFRKEQLLEDSKEDYVDEDGELDENKLDEDAAQFAYDDWWEFQNAYKSVERESGWEIHTSSQSDIYEIFDDDGTFIEHMDSYSGHEITLNHAQERVTEILREKGDVIYSDEYADQEDEIEPTRYGDANLVVPGGENYQEVLLTLPDRQPLPVGEIKVKEKEHSYIVSLGQYKIEVGKGVVENKEAAIEYAKPLIIEKETAAVKSRTYTGAHFTETKNILAHFRFNERTDADGKKIMFLEEIQSDYGAAYRNQVKNIEKAITNNFKQIVKSMEKAGVVEEIC